MISQLDVLLSTFLIEIMGKMSVSKGTRCCPLLLLLFSAGEVSGSAHLGVPGSSDVGRMVRLSLGLLEPNSLEGSLRCSVLLRGASELASISLLTYDVGETCEPYAQPAATISNFFSFSPR